MYSLTEVPAVAYQDPWKIPFVDRMRTLSRGQRRVAYFYECPNNSTFRYRVYNMAQVLNAGNDEVAATYFFLEDVDRFEEIADLADILVICRSRYDHCVRRLVSSFQKRGKRVLFDIDDLVFNTDYTHLLIKTLDLDVADPQVWQDWFAYCSRMGAALKMCDGAITTTESLAVKIHDFSGLPVSVVPNFMNYEQLDMSERVFAAKQNQAPAADGLIHLGYFSGSPSHNRDFAMVIPALEDLLEEDPRLGVVVVGYIEAGPRLERFGKRVKRFAFHDYVNLQKLIGSVEINLMPLQFNVFTNSKSELKYFEAAAVGTRSIASPSTVYARAIRHGHNGYLSQAHEWSSVIREAVSRLGDQEMVLLGREDALSKYAWVNQRQRIRSALGL